MNYTKEQIEAFIYMFKAIPEQAVIHRSNKKSKKESVEASAAVQNGFCVLQADGSILPEISRGIFKILKTVYGTNEFCGNQTFHKSFSTVMHMSPEEYFAEQLIHYFSTYGLEFLGLKARPYVPVEELELPKHEELAEDWKSLFHKKRLVIVRLVSDDDAAALCDYYAKTTVAPSEDDVKRFLNLMPLLTIQVEEIKSFELQAVRYQQLGTCPSEPVQFLRILVYEVTGSTLLIKNDTLISEIKSAAGIPEKAKFVHSMLANAKPADLASIFLRYKPIFLAFKSYGGCAPVINRIRRLAVKYHKPLSMVNLRNVTELLKQGRTQDVDKVLEYASNRELVKLWNALYARIEEEPYFRGVYAIRNRRTFVDSEERKYPEDLQKCFKETTEKIQNILVSRLTPAWSGKCFVMPGYIDYAVPTTEKQFLGNYPWGTKIVATPDNAFTVGIWWFNQKDKRNVDRSNNDDEDYEDDDDYEEYGDYKDSEEEMRVDIDLHLNSVGESYGWNSAYRDEKAEVIYTGDQTSAPQPDGAAEAFWFDPAKGDFILSVNLYSGPDDTEFKLYMTNEKPETRSQSYVYNPEHSLFPTVMMNFHKGNDMTIGLFANGSFYIAGGSINRGIVPSASYGPYIEGLKGQFETKLRFSALFSLCGVHVVENAEELKEEERAKAVDLSPEALTATTLLELIDSEEEGM